MNLLTFTVPENIENKYQKWFSLPDKFWNEFVFCQKNYLNMILLCRTKKRSDTKI